MHAKNGYTICKNKNNNYLKLMNVLTGHLESKGKIVRPENFIAQDYLNSDNSKARTIGNYGSQPLIQLGGLS